MGGREGVRANPLWNRHWVEVKVFRGWDRDTTVKSQKFEFHLVAQKLHRPNLSRLGQAK